MYLGCANCGSSAERNTICVCAIAWLSSMWQTKIKDPSQTTMMMILHFITMNALESKHHIASHHITTMQIIQWLPITFDSISKWVQWCKGKNVLCRFYCHTQTHTNPVSPNLCWCHMKSNCFCTEFDRQSPKSIVMPATHTTSVWCLMHGANLPNCWQTITNLVHALTPYTPSLLFNLMKIPTPEGSSNKISCWKWSYVGKCN